MSDDLFNTLGADAIFEEEEEQAEDTGEKQNKTFLIAVAALGGLLLLSLIAFGVWALVINPRMQRAAQQALGGVPTEMPTATVETPVASPEVEETPTPAATVPPTNTPKPTPTLTATPVIKPTATPESGAASTGSETTPTATPRARRTETPAPTTAGGGPATPRPTGSGTAGSTTRTPDTGFGEVALVAIALLLVGVFFTARRLRKV